MNYLGSKKRDVTLFCILVADFFYLRFIFAYFVACLRSKSRRPLWLAAAKRAQK